MNLIGCFQRRLDYQGFDLMKKWPHWYFKNFRRPPLGRWWNFQGWKSGSWSKYNLYGKAHAPRAASTLAIWATFHPVSLLPSCICNAQLCPPCLHGEKYLKPWAHINTFSLNCVSVWSFVTVMKKVTDIHCFWKLMVIFFWALMVVSSILITFSDSIWSSLKPFRVLSS